MKEENGKSGVKGKRNHLYVALGCAAVLIAAAIIITSVALASRGNSQLNEGNINSSSDVGGGDSDSGSGNGGNSDSGSENPEKPVVGTDEGFDFPLTTVTVLNEYGFYHNQTLNNYYEHQAIDFTAAAGTEVLAAAAGTVESVYTSDILLGTQITVDHGNGLKSVYTFVDAKEGLKAGDKVKKGDVIAKVAEANGKEYKDGTHLHFEILKEGKSVDPATYLTLEEK